MKKLFLILIILLLIVIVSIKFIHLNNFNISATSIKSPLNDKDLTTKSYQGTIRALHMDDFDNKKTSTEYYLYTKDEKILKVNFLSLPPEDIDQSQVSFVGQENYSQIDIEPKNLKITSTPQNKITSSINVTNPLTSNKKLGVILFNFQNDLTQDYTSQDAKQKIFLDTSSSPQAINGYFREVSNDKFKFIGALDPTGDVFGWYTLAVNNSPCGVPSTWVSLAQQFAIADGFVAGNYDSIMYIFPHTTSCPFNAAVLGSISNAFINGPLYFTAMRHELGHTLGMSHSHSLVCRDSIGTPKTISEICGPDEYGDLFDTMGYAWDGRHFNNFMKYALNFLTSSQIKTIQTSGTYTLYAADLPSINLGNKGIEIPIESNSSGNTTASYYLEYRRPYGVYDSFSPTDPVVNGLSIRIRKPAQGYLPIGQTYLLDTNPQTTTMYDAPLLFGQTFSDVDRGITISASPNNPTGSSASMSSIKVNININQQPWLCVKNNPLAILSPSSQSTSAGTLLSYSLAITNQDNLNCPPSVYQVGLFATIFPLNTDFGFTPQNFYSNPIKPGSTQTYNVQVSKPSQNLLGDVHIPPGSYSFYASVKEALWHAYNSYPSAIYQVQ